MRNGTRVLLLALTLAGIGTGAVAQSTLPGPVDWDCWVGHWRGDVALRCIRARDALPISDDVLGDDPQAAPLEHLHSLLHTGSARELNAAADRYAAYARHGEMWAITIHHYPSQDSWREQRPQTLVHALLCSGGEPCRVAIRGVDF